MRRVAALGTCGLVLLAACAGGPEGPQRQAAHGLAPPADWSTGLGELMPAIRACLADREAGAGAVGVTKAWPIGQQLAGVRLLQEDGDRVDCVAAAGGDEVFLTERVHEASHLQGERDPLFTPAAHTPPNSPCLQSSAAAEGWLSYDVCRNPRPIGSAAMRRAPARTPAPAREG